MENPLSNDRLLDHTQGRLSPNEMAEISRRLAEDPVLQQRYAELRRLRRLIRERYQPETVAWPDVRDAEISSTIASFVEAIQNGVALPAVPMPEVAPTDGLGIVPATSEAEPWRVRTDRIEAIPIIQPMQHRHAHSVWGRMRGFGTAAAASVLAALAFWSFMDDQRVNIGGLDPSAVAVDITDTLPPLPDFESAIGRHDLGTAAPTTPTPSALTPMVPDATPDAVAEVPRNPIPAPTPDDSGAVVEHPPLPMPGVPVDAVNPTDEAAVARPDHLPGQPRPDDASPGSTPVIEAPPTAPSGGTGRRPRGPELPTGAFSDEHRMLELIGRAADATSAAALRGRDPETSPDYVVAAGVRRGDVDGNGIVDHRDAERLLRHLLKGDAETVFGALADTNRDGRVDSRDYMRLRAEVGPDAGPDIRAAD